MREPLHRSSMCRVVPAILSAHAGRVLSLTSIHSPDDMVDAGWRRWRNSRGAPKGSPTATPPLERAPDRVEPDVPLRYPSLVEWHQDLPTEPDLDPSRMGGRGRFSPAASRPALFVRRAQGCPEPRARGSGAATRDRTCAPGPTSVRSPHSISADPGSSRSQA
jgi:hypothetical protein